mmetsp:Transcript_117116/g.227697  ORF Transcript_117116/g.227697 Transcript_117116/m.227697 type:complete len:81 (-) Transcript_117116:380-622(-)
MHIPAANKHSACVRTCSLRSLHEAALAHIRICDFTCFHLLPLGILCNSLEVATAPFLQQLVSLFLRNIGRFGTARAAVPH